MTAETEAPAPSPVEAEAASTAPQEIKAVSSDVITINSKLLNYSIIAVVFLVVGLVIGQTIAPGGDLTVEMISTAVVRAVKDASPIQAAAPGKGRVDVSVDDDPAWGPEDASVVVVEFSDFQCPYCESFYKETYPRLREAYGDKIRFVFRDMPLTQIHPDAILAAEAAGCASEQDAFWDYHDLLFTNQKDLSRQALGSYATELGLNMTTFSGCLDSHRYQDEVAGDMQDASIYGIQGTPTFFINGFPLVGAQPFEVFARVIDRELAKTAAGS